MSSTKRWGRYGGAAGLVASGLIAGGVLGGTFTAGAAEDTGAQGAGSSMSRPSGEEPLTGETRTRVEAAVLAAYPGATIQRTESDSGGGYESHIVTAEGERLTVPVDQDFAVTGTQPGRGGRGPGRGECPEDATPDTTQDPATEEPETSGGPITEAPEGSGSES